MMRLPILLLLAATAMLAIHARAQSVPTAEACTLMYTGRKLTEGFDFCVDTEAFALCIATAPSNAYIKTAEAILANAQEENSQINCDFKVTPSFRVVDREVRASLELVGTYLGTTFLKLFVNAPPCTETCKGPCVHCISESLDPPLHVAKRVR